MNGTRVEWNSQLLNPCEYSKLPDGIWFCCSPNGHTGNLCNHTVIEHEDGTITVSPSILIQVSDSNGNKTELWHGFLERGVWRSC